MIEVDGTSYCIDPAGGIAAALGRKWTLPLIGILGNRTTNRFVDLERDLEGIGAKALADRLRDLRRLGLVERRSDEETPTRVDYRLTEKGAELRRALVPLLTWAARPPSEVGNR